MNSYRPMKRNTIIKKCLKNGEPVHHYTISKNIGRGGSGFTYLAQDETGKPCVIKEYIPFNNRYSFVRNSNDVLVFNSTVSESQKKTITNKLIQIATHEYDINHKAMITEAGDNSPYIFDFTTFSDTSSDVIYGLIQTVEGEVFSEYITHITTEEKIHLLLKVSDAIKYINSRGILHADLTPENIYVNSMGQVQILDFGASMDIGKFRRGTTEDKKKFARNLLSTNVGSLSRYYCSENLLTFANSINFVSNDNESDINKIVDILSNNISYADDIYSFKQIILFTLIGAPEAKIYLSSMTVEEYICDKLKDNFSITVTHLLCKLVHTNEFDLNILTDFLKLIDCYKFTYRNSMNGLICPNEINNSLDDLDLQINHFGFFYLLTLMKDLHIKIKELFGAPFWFIRDLDLEFALTLCTFPLEVADRIDEYGALKSIYIPDKVDYFIEIFYNNFDTDYIFKKNTCNNDELTNRRLLSQKILTDLYCLFENHLQKVCEDSSIPQIYIKILLETVNKVKNSGSDIVCYKEPIKYNSNQYFSEEEKAQFIINQIYHEINKRNIKWPDINPHLKLNLYNLFFQDNFYYPKVIYTNNFNEEIKKQSELNTQTLFKFLIRYDDNLIFEKLNTITIDSKPSTIQSEFPTLEDVYGSCLNTIIIIGVPNKNVLLNLISTVSRYSKIVCLIDNNYEPIKDEIHKIMAALHHGGIKKEMLYKITVHDNSKNKILSEKEINDILYNSADIFCINEWFYLSYQGCKQNFVPGNDDILTELLINFLSDNPKPSYRDNLFLDGILSSLHNDVLTKTLEDNNITIFQKIISYLKSANCTWLTTTFTEYFKTLIINNLNTWDNAIYSYDLAILRYIYLIEDLFNETDFDNIIGSIYDIKYHNKSIEYTCERYGSIIYNFLPLQINGNIATIPDGMLFISADYFLYEGNKKFLSDIQEIIFSDYTVYIGRDTFKYCKNLRKIRLPRNLKYLNTYAFDSCNENIEIDWQNIDSFLAFEYGEHGVSITKEEYIKRYLKKNSYLPSIEEYIKRYREKDPYLPSLEEFMKSLEDDDRIYLKICLCLL